MELVLSWILLASIFLNVVLLIKPRVKYVEVIKKVFVPTDVTIKRVKEFFQTLQPILQEIYTIVDSHRAKTGRTPLDHHFQINFLIYHWIWGKSSLDATHQHVNKEFDLQTVLGMPGKKYHSATMTRFLQRIGRGGLTRVMVVCVRYAVKQGILRLKRILFDTFPVYSCIRSKKFFTQAYQALRDLDGVLSAVDWS